MQIRNKNILKNIQETVKNENYALRPHVVSHMLAEGFYESDIIETIGSGRILEHYSEEERCLIIGTFQLSENVKESLHIVVDYWSESEVIDWVDFITAYIPRQPFWETPHKRGRKK